MSKLKKYDKDLSDLGATWPRWLPTDVDHMAQLAPKSNKDNNQNLALYITARRGKYHCLAASFKPKRPSSWWLCWLSCIWAGFHATMYHLVLKVVGITLFPKDPYDTFGCMNTFSSLYRFSFSRASPSAKGISITPFPRDPYDTVG